MTMSIILIIICIIIAIVMITAIVKFHNLVNETKEKADSMTEEEKMSYSPFAQDDNNENTSID